MSGSRLRSIEKKLALNFYTWGRVRTDREQMWLDPGGGDPRYSCKELGETGTTFNNLVVLNQQHFSLIILSMLTCFLFHFWHICLLTAFSAW